MKKTLKTIKFEHLAVYLILVVMLILTASVIKRSKEQSDLRNKPVDVLTDWSLTVDGTQAYRAGDTVPVTSKFTKLLDIKPIKPARFVQCVKREKIALALAQFNENKLDLKEIDWDGKFIAPEGSGSADKGKNVSTVNIVLPFALGDLPNICRINFAPSYNVNEYHQNFQESAYSNPFKVDPRPGVSVVDSTTTYVYTDSSEPNDAQAMINIVPQQGERVIIYQTPPAEDTPPQEEKPRPGFIRGTVNNVGNFVKELF